MVEPDAYAAVFTLAQRVLFSFRGPDRRPPDQLPRIDPYAKVIPPDPSEPLDTGGITPEWIDRCWDVSRLLGLDAKGLAILRAERERQRRADLRTHERPPKVAQSRLLNKKRRWTQPELNKAIRDLRARYRGMIEQARRGKPGARQEVLRIFRRHALADRLGVKSRRMVTDSPDWRQLAEEVNLPRKGALDGSRRTAKIGLGIALAQAADTSDLTQLDTATHNETLRTLCRAIEAAKGPKQRSEFQSVWEQFELGEMTDDQACRMLDALQGG